MNIFARVVFLVGLVIATQGLTSGSANANWTGAGCGVTTGCSSVTEACEEASKTWYPGNTNMWVRAEFSIDAEGNPSYLRCKVIAYCCGALYTGGYNLHCPPGETPAFTTTGCSGGEPIKNTCPVAGNPVKISNGAKLQTFEDFSTGGADPLSFNRYYNSFSPRLSLIAPGWRHSFERVLIPENGSWTSPTFIDARRHDGRQMRFTLTGSVYLSDTDIDMTLVQNGSDWELTLGDGMVELYDATGQLQSIETASGYTQTLAYTGSQITTVTDSYGRQITFTYITGGSTFPDKLETVTDPDGKVYTFAYDKVGRLTQVTFDNDTTEQYHYEDTAHIYFLTGITDENGVRFATWEYDSAGRVILSKHAGDVEETTFSYDTVNDITTVTNALGKQTKYHFSTVVGDLKVTEVEGVASANCVADDSVYAYDTNGYRSSWTDREGNVTTYVNNSRGLETSRTEASGTAQARTITTTWHSSWAKPTQIVRPNLTIDFTYDTKGNVLTRTETDTTGHSVPYVTNGQTRTWTYTYTYDGTDPAELEKIEVDGPLAGTGDTVTYDYDADGYLDKVTDELGHETDITAVDGLGRPTSITDTNGIISDLTYDLRGRLLTRTVNPGAGEALTAFTYDKVGQITQILLPDGTTLDYTYDDAHRLTKVTNALGEEIVYTLDDLGNVTQEQIKDAGGTLKKTMTATFDELGRMLKSIGASSQETQFTYRKTDDLASVTDPKSHVTQYAYDALNRLITVTDPLTNDADTDYDAADNVTDVTDQRSLTTSYVHNGFGDVIRRDSPDTGITDYEYDAAGNMTKKTDARSVVTNYAYDEASRLTSKTFPASTGENVAYTYDDVTGGNYGTGRLTKIEDESGSTSYVYDARGNVITETRVIGAQSYTTEYSYDLADNLIGMVYPSGRIVTYIRDDLGRIQRVTTKKSSTDPEQFLAASVDYLPFGPVKSFTFGNGQKVTLSYDQDYRITGIETTDGSTDVQDLAYGYDLASNITGITDALDSSRTQTLDYDALDRLTDATGIYGDLDYAYDAVSNRTSRVIADGSTTTETLTYDTNSNRLLTLADGSTTRTLTYTTNGHTTTDSRGSGFTYLYNHADRMEEVQENSATLATYLYNDLGQRVVKALSGGATTHYHFDQGGMLIAESTDAGVGLRDYVHLGSLPIAIVEAGTTPTAPTETTEDNDGTGASFTGTWNTFTDGTGYEGTDYRTREGGTGTESFTWTPTIPADGLYRIYAKWPADPDLGSTATYTVHHANGSNEHTVDQRTDGGQWNLLGVYPLETAQNNRVELSDETETFDPDTEIVIDNNDENVTVVGSWNVANCCSNLDIWDTDRIWTTPGSGEKSITWKFPDEASGHYRIYSFCTQHVNHPTDLKYVVHHADGSTDVTINQEVNGGEWVFLGSYDVTSNSNHRVYLDNDQNGDMCADAIRMQKVHKSYSDDLIVDNMDPSVTTTGTWITSSWNDGGRYWDTNFHQASAGSGGSTITWPAPVTEQGRYLVYARWTMHIGQRASNAEYEIHHAGGQTTVTVDQNYSGGNWVALGEFTLAPGQNHRVMLDNDVNGKVIGDAIRFLRLPPSSAATEELIVDNSDAGVSTTGSWIQHTYTGTGFFWGPNYLYIGVGSGEATVQWSADVATPGQYHVYARWVAGNNSPTNAKYTIQHSGGSTEVETSQKYHTTQWVSLGSYHFDASEDHYVELSNDANGTWIVADVMRFVPENAVPKVLADAIKIVPNTAEDALYVHADHLGSPQKMTDASAAVVWDATYRPFGEEDGITGTATNNKRFPGQYKDAESGLHYNYFRDYDPTTGRYLQPDPIRRFIRAQHSGFDTELKPSRDGTFARQFREIPRESMRSIGGGER